MQILDAQEDGKKKSQGRGSFGKKRDDTNLSETLVETGLDGIEKDRLAGPGSHCRKP